MRDISDLLKKQQKPDTEITDEELARQQYLADIARMRDFRTDAERMVWPKPIGPRWKN